MFCIYASELLTLFIIADIYQADNLCDYIIGDLTLEIFALTKANLRNNILIMEKMIILVVGRHMGWMV
ncbi:hypothetical protein [Bartonella tamiae]|uniref:Uncharacterized protein n=1 Tax=Bartonella tamiae Th239 TaxID=1094558 RepID=J1JUL7_9HYPH|nr:hypothetical protein [Bartonella tamiae]EJF88647.1 hypothetical protein ME5_01198 [Bartonella tamiae Th239]EJF95103.1 hypothetical protein MEG_00684 [Bartonella tamiae Th307]